MSKGLSSLTRQPKTEARYGPRSIYTTELAREICDMITGGFSLKHIASMEGMPSLSCILSWLVKHEEFYVMYYTARQLQMEILVEEMLAIADDETKDKDEEGWNSVKVARDRLKVDTRKWIAAKLASKIYGDRVQVDATMGTKATLVILDGSSQPDPKMIEGQTIDGN